MKKVFIHCCFCIYVSTDKVRAVKPCTARVNRKKCMALKEKKVKLCEWTNGACKEKECYTFRKTDCQIVPHCRYGKFPPDIDFIQGFSRRECMSTYASTSGEMYEIKYDLEQCRLNECKQDDDACMARAAVKHAFSPCSARSHRKKCMMLKEKKVNLCQWKTGRASKRNAVRLQK